MAEQKKPVMIRTLDPDIYHRAKVAALTAKVSVGAWIGEAIKQRLDREKGAI